MADLIRASYNHTAMMPNLMHDSAVLMLLEMGLDKITRDYMFTFLGKASDTTSITGNQIVL